MFYLKHNSDVNPDYIPMNGYNNEEISMNDPVLDETRLGSAIVDMPHYNYGSVRQLATYLQSIQEKIIEQKRKNIRDSEQHMGSESVVDYTGWDSDNNPNDQTRIRDSALHRRQNQRETHRSEAEPIVRSRPT